jgi:uncharacterized Zn-binding protein involved in type VI secretion
MKAAGRTGDHSSCGPSGSGPAVTGSSNILINGRGALRVGDIGVTPSCCESRQWSAEGGAPSVLFNGRRAHRRGDGVAHEAVGRLIFGSSNVVIGDYARASSPRRPGIHLRLRWPDGTPLPDRPYRLHGPEERSGVLSGGWIDERDLPEGQYLLDIDGTTHSLWLR